MTNQRNNNDKIMTRKDDHHQRDYNYYNYNNTDPGVFPGKLPPAEAMDMIAEAYRANIGDRITRAAASIIEEALTHGMEPDTVVLAIEETGLASRPSPYYLRAILMNWAYSGVTVSRVRETQGITDARPWWK